MDMVEPGRLDLTFGVLPLPEGPFGGVELLHDPFVLVTAAASPLAAFKGMPTLELIGDQRLIGFRSCRSTKWVEAQLRASGFEPNFVFRSEDNGTVQAMASAGPRHRHRPAHGRRPVGPAIAIIPTDLEPRRIALMWHRDRYRSPASRAFVDIAREVCREPRAGPPPAGRRCAPDRPWRRPMGHSPRGGSEGARWYTPAVPDNP